MLFGSFYFLLFIHKHSGKVYSGVVGNAFVSGPCTNPASCIDILDPRYLRTCEKKIIMMIMIIS